jgi:outer membrane protein TolC
VTVRSAAYEFLPRRSLRGVRRTRGRWHRPWRNANTPAGGYPSYGAAAGGGERAHRRRDGRFYSLGPTLLWPIFDAGKIRANIAVQDARAQELLAAYRPSILTAIEEVEDALVALDREKKRGEELANAVAANEQAASLARQLYGEGLADFLSVLDAERSLYDSQDAVAQSERAATLDLVALYKALGGGWEATQVSQLALAPDSRVNQPDEAGPSR